MRERLCLEKTYAGLLGKNIGIRLGAPVEPSLWTYERIKRFYGDIHGYVKPFINFAADDDINGPVYFLRSLDDAGLRDHLDAKDVGEAWLNYAREGVGMFWWGGYGVSTEHTAYLNLKAGMAPPESGSMAINGKVLSEQIGGQIFIDTWGFVWPGNPQKAAQFAQTAASVSHDGEALQGAGFIAACIANAYVCGTVEEVFDRSLQVLSANCTYRNVLESVRLFHDRQPDDWEACMRYLLHDWGYDKYGGACHVIPNAGVCAMALLYGKHFARGVEIATMAGWDTDCNAGNVGSILGVLDGLEGIPESYREPMHDNVVLSGISGYLNILDLPTYAKKLYILGCRLEKREIPSGCGIQEGEVAFDFSLPGSTHGFRISDPSLCRIRHSEEGKTEGHGSLEILFDRMVRGQGCKVFYKNFYRRKDFSDERYMPVFSPTAYAGQNVSFSLKVERYNGESIIIQPYVHDSNKDVDVKLGGQVVVEDGWMDVSFVIPALDGDLCDEIGFVLEGNSPEKCKDFGVVLLTDFSITGNADYSINLVRQKKEFGSVGGFSHNHGSWDLVADGMQVLCLGHAEAMTGNYYGADESIEGDVRMHHGSSAMLSVRVQGAMRGYYGGFHKGNLVIAKTVGGNLQVLVSEPYPVEQEKTYACRFEAIGKSIALWIGDKKMLTVEDISYDHGMVGYAVYENGRVSFGSPIIHQEMERQGRFV